MIYSSVLSNIILFSKPPRSFAFVWRISSSLLISIFLEVQIVRRTSKISAASSIEGFSKNSFTSSCNFFSNAS